jgi:hypothetical protein
MRLTEEDLAARTLARQFPGVPGRDETAVLELFRRLGPIQSQVPRAPFLTVASRLPGTPYRAVQALFEQFRLLKTSTLRGTVHTSGREHHPWLEAVARHSRAGSFRSRLGLEQAQVEALLDELEAWTDDGWRPRAEIVAHGRAWLREHISPASADAVNDTFTESLLWGHSGLLRRPRDDHWEKRTDIYHRRARSVVPELATGTYAASVQGLTRTYLASVGPGTRRDVAYFLGVGLGAVDAAVTALGAEVVPLTGPDGETYLDLAEPPAVPGDDPGVRLLPEFDALLVGFHLSHRTRFLSAVQLAQVWARVNGQFSPTVLHRGRLVGLWRTVARGSRVDLELTPLDGAALPGEDELTAPVAALGQALDLRIQDVRLGR